MVILTNEEKRAILLKAQAMSVGYPGSERNCQEVCAALLIIEKTLGKQWYQKAMKGYYETIKSINTLTANIPSSHEHLLKDDTRPPLTRLLMGGVPSNIAQIIQFATYIQELSNDTNVQDKLDDYVNQERRVELSFSHFTRLLFELKVATIYKRGGLVVRFFPKQKRVTPDFEVASPLGKTYVECKRKDINTKLSSELNDIYKQIVVGIQNEMSQLQLNYSVRVSINKEATIEDIKPAISIAHDNLTQNQDHFKATYGVITVEGTRLANYNAIHSSKEIPEAPSGSTLQNYDYYCECQVRPPPIHDFLNLRNADLPIRNFRVVAVYSSFLVSIVQSILNSIKVASTQLLESSGYGVIAIEISFDQSIPSAELEVRKAIDSIPSLFESMPHIDAVILFLEEVYSHAGQTHRHTTGIRLLNPAASHKLLSDMEEIMKKNPFTPHKSLLD
jgi:hypothetical protein